MRKPSRKAPPAAPRARNAGSRLLRELRGYAEALAVAFLVVTFAFTTVGVAGSSMEPNLYGGEAGDALAKQLLVGDRVFIPKYETWLRCAGVLGQYGRGDVLVNGLPVNQDFLACGSPGCIEPLDFPRARIENGRVAALRVGFEGIGATTRPVLPNAGRTTGFVAVDDARRRGDLATAPRRRMELAQPRDERGVRPS